MWGNTRRPSEGSERERAAPEGAARSIPLMRGAGYGYPRIQEFMA